MVEARVNVCWTVCPSTASNCTAPVACATPVASGVGYAAAVATNVPTGTLLKVSSASPPPAGRAAIWRCDQVSPYSRVTATLSHALGINRSAAGQRIRKLTPPDPATSGADELPPQPGSRLSAQTSTKCSSLRLRMMPSRPVVLPERGPGAFATSAFGPLPQNRRRSRRGRPRRRRHRPCPTVASSCRPWPTASCSGEAQSGRLQRRLTALARAAVAGPYLARKGWSPCLPQTYTSPDGSTVRPAPTSSPAVPNWRLQSSLPLAE